ncbi:glutamate-rich protein 6 isoform X3 [Catharus ustulatus]|uniref:glutamate-rich protein 6 isoform X3 n=1 Tax=Catharus ustulatus TaxID=91951 RepID=UPI00140D8E50|nr:glutamate-rich protein 6 isoform X3 [Catharus ustulatus]
MDGPGWAAEPSGGPDDGVDDGAGEPRWPWPLEKGTVHLAEPRFGTPPASPQPTPTGLPTLLAYRPESSPAIVHHKAEDAEPTCEYCGNPLRPFPFCEDTPLSEDQADRFCCERSRELYEFITKEKKKLEDTSSLPRAVGNQESLGSETSLLLSKEQENRRQQRRQLARELADQSLKPSATEGSQQAGSVSLELTSPTGGTTEPVVIAAEPKPQPKEKPEPEPQSEEKPKLEPQPKEELEPKCQPKEKPEPEPQPKKELELEPQPKEKPEPEPQPKEKPEPEPQPKEELELKPQPKEKPELEPQPKGELDLKPQPKEKPEPESQPKGELDLKPQPKEKPEPESQPKGELDLKPQPKEKPEPEPQPKELELKPQPMEKPEPEPQPKEELELKPQLKEKSKPELRPKEKPKSEPQPNGELKLKPQPKEKSKPELRAKEKPKSEPQPNRELKLKPQPKEKSKPELRPKDKPELEPQLKEKSKPELRPKDKPELEPQLKEKSKPELRPKDKPELEPQLKEKSKPELRPKDKPEPEPQPKGEPQLEPQLKQEPGLKKMPGPKEEPELEPRPEEKPKPQPWPEEKPELEPQPKGETQLEPQLKEEPGPKEEPQLEPHPEQKPGSEPKLKPKKEPKHKEPVSRGTRRYDFSLLGKKVGKAKLVQKYYKNGKKFLTMLQDGTSQLFYPSGNLAIVIIRGRDQLTCIVQEDELRTTKIRALFQSDGRGTCYYPNGDEWINISIQGGQYLDQAGNRVRRWMWPDLSRGPYAPLSPIFISLNRHVGVRILAQDKIFVSFLAKGRQAKFNMGTKVQVLFLCRAVPHSRSRASRKLPSAFILWWVLPMLSHAPFPKSKLWLYGYSCHSYGDGHLASPSSLQRATVWDSTHRQVPGHSPKGHPGYDPRGQGAGQLLSSAGSWHRGRFVC